MVNHIVRLTSYPETIEEEGSEAGSPDEEDPSSQTGPGGQPDGGLDAAPSSGEEQPLSQGAAVVPAPTPEDKDVAESQKRRRLEEAGIKVMPAAQRFARLELLAEADLAGLLHACRFGIRLASWTSHPASPVPVCPLHHSSPALDK